MKHKRKHLRQVSSSNSQSDQYDSYQQRSDIDSQGSSSSNISSTQQIYEQKRLNKKDLKKLIQLEKKIQKQEKILQKIKAKKKSKSTNKKASTKKQYTLKQERSQTQTQTSTSNQAPQKQLESKKLFITGIEEWHKYDQVANQLNQALKNLQGVKGFRIKMRQKCPTYAFVDFQTKQNAREGMDALRRKRIFGGKVAIYYSQDEMKQITKTKKCFQCNEIGHVARQCQYKKIKEIIQEVPQNYEKQLIDNPTLVKLQELQKPKASPPQKCIENQPQAEKLLVNSKRIIRDKSRVNRIFSQS